MAKKQVVRPERALRVALVWNQSLLQEEELLELEPVGLGDGFRFPIPEGVVESDSLPLLEPTGTGYGLRISPALSGSVWMRGERREVQSLGTAGASVPLGPDDYGVVTVGPVAVFFQSVKPAEPLPRAFFKPDPGLLAAFGLTFFLAIASIVLVVAEYRPRDIEPFELDADLVAQFLVTPPPEDILEQLRPESGTETEDPGLRGREETGGERHRGEEGRVGHEDATTEDTHIQGEVTDRVTATKVRSVGLLGALSGGGQENAIAQALDVPTISDILGGMGDAPTVVGRGSRGAGLRGVGTGGGGTGEGSLFGAGDVGTGVGAGTGGGVGRGTGGIGARGTKRAEVQISVTRGQPRVSGYLSPEQIERVVRANQSAIRYCYEIEVQRQPNLRGRVEVAWRIDRSGAVASARVGSSTLRNAGVEGCLVRQIRRWRFPEPDGGEVNVSYPFIFGVGG